MEYPAVIEPVKPDETATQVQVHLKTTLKYGSKHVRSLNRLHDNCKRGNVLGRVRQDLEMSTCNSYSSCFKQVNRVPLSFTYHLVVPLYRNPE